MGEQFVEGKHGLVAGRRRNVVSVGESRGEVCVTAWRVNSGRVVYLFIYSHICIPAVGLSTTPIRRAGSLR